MQGNQHNYNYILINKKNTAQDIPIITPQVIELCSY